jgi:deoxycytidine triphosphate deaminase
MSISQETLVNLIVDNELIITPYDRGYVIDNHYELHPRGTITVYDSMYAIKSLMGDTETVKSETFDLTTNYGFIIEPGKLYHIPLEETIRCTNYTCRLEPNAQFTKYGLTISVINNSTLGNGSEITIAVNTTYPLVVYPNMALCDLYVDSSIDGGLGSIPVGAIIGWNGTQIPYGWSICDGSNGTPNLIGSFIVGGRTNQLKSKEVAIQYGNNVYSLIFIMRYK